MTTVVVTTTTNPTPAAVDFSANTIRVHATEGASHAGMPLAGSVVFTRTPQGKWVRTHHTANTHGAHLHPTTADGWARPYLRAAMATLAAATAANAAADGTAPF